MYQTTISDTGLSTGVIETTNLAVSYSPDKTRLYRPIRIDGKR